MITTAKQSTWWGDCEIRNLQAAGLPAQSVVRPKIFTLDCELIVGALGMLAALDIKELSVTFQEIGLVGLQPR